MPIPKPDPEENNAKFIARCMSDNIMKKEYPDNKERIAVCLGQTKSSLIEQVGQILIHQSKDDIDDEDTGQEVTLSNLFIPKEEDYIDCNEPTEIWELSTIAAEYQGRKVTLNKPFRTPDGPKKFAVYVKNNKGKVIIVRFGDPNLSIKRDDPNRRKSFRARHKCDQKKDKTTPGYWSCYQWRSNSPVKD